MDRLQTVQSALTFAAKRLGPHSEAKLRSPECQVRILARVREGTELEDAVLAEVHRAALGDHHVADEFLAHFLTDLLRRSKGTLGAGLRRFLDTGDLVQSVMGDVWQELAAIRFETRAAFLSLLGMRVRWKVNDEAKSNKRLRRGGDRQREPDPADVSVAASGPGPLTACGSAEESERLALTLLRMEPRDRDVLTRFLRGESPKTISEALGLSPESARKVVQRAVRRARKLAHESPG